MAIQYATISQTEKKRPSRRTPGSVSRKASIAGEWYILKNSTAVAIAPAINAAIAIRHTGSRVETVQ